MPASRSSLRIFDKNRSGAREARAISAPLSRRSGHAVARTAHARNAYTVFADGHTTPAPAGRPRCAATFRVPRLADTNFLDPYSVVRGCRAQGAPRRPPD